MKAHEEGMGTEERFDDYLNRLAGALGHLDRMRPLREYCIGLVLPGERKTVEPMAARIDPLHVRAKHQSLHHFVANSDWDDEALMKVALEYALPSLDTSAKEFSWIIDDTGIPKRGRLMVGASRQYCGQTGKRDNCQVAVSLSLATDVASLPVAYRLYLSEDWANDSVRRKRAGVPEELVFETKLEIALGQIRQALADSLPVGTVVFDAGYGESFDFRQQIRELDLKYVAGIKGTTTVWRPGEAPLPPKRPKRLKGRPPTSLRRNRDHKPLSARALALEYGRQAFRKVTWRDGAKGVMSSSFLALRVRPAHRDYKRKEPHEEEWLLIEWPESEAEPTRYWLSNLSSYTSKKLIVRKAKIRHRIERDYQELKQELGIGHYKGRGWRGFHHHATLCIVAYAFLMRERLSFSPSGETGGRPRIETPPVPRGFRSRGSPGSH